MRAAFFYSVLLWANTVFGLSTADQYQLFFFTDSLGAFHIQDIQEDQWCPVKPNQTISHGFNVQTNVWCKLIYIRDSSLKNDLYWCFNNNHLDSILVFDEVKAYGVLGDRTDRLSPYVSCLAFPLESKNDTVVLFARVKKILSFIDFDMDLKTESELIRNSNQTVAMASVYIGLAVLLLMINLFVWSQRKDRKFIYYLIYSAIGIVYVLVNLGVARYIVGKEFVFLSEVRIYSGTFWFLALLIFLSELLGMKRNFYFGYITINALGIVTGILAVVGLLALQNNWFKVIQITSFLSYVDFFVALLALMAGIAGAIRRGERIGWYVMISFFPHILWALSVVLTGFNITGFGFRVDWIGIIMLYEMLFFGWILFTEYIETFKANNRLQVKIIENDRKLIEVTERARMVERTQLADILHDKFGIDIASTIHLIEMNNYEEAINMLTKLGGELRELSHTILPMSLKEGVLDLAVQTQIDILNNRNRTLNIQFSTFDFPSKVTPEIAFMMYLISLEIIQNAVKHAEAKEISAEFYGYPEELVFSFADDGIGLSADVKKGYGLMNIEARVKDKGGEFTITSHENTGTQILIQLPWKKESNG